MNENINSSLNHSHGISHLSIFLIFIIIIIIIGVIMAVFKDNKKLDSKEEEQSLTYSDLEKELEKQFKEKGVEWYSDLGINSVYLSLLKELINNILYNINDEDIQDIIEKFKRKRCREIKNIQIPLKFRDISEPLNFSMYFQEENITGENLNQKIKKLAEKYCENAVNRVKEKIDIDLKYNNKEGIIKTLKEMLNNI